ncbi:MAG: quinolinate synthase NadA [Bdellovibrionota bacterium]
MLDIRQEILNLKKEKGALILAHFYEDGEIQELADHVGDSYFLAETGMNSDANIILLAGVVFMGESVKILSPDKKVIVPDLKAGCSLVTSSPFAKYKAWKDAHPNSVMMTYINSSAEVKSISDVICTSSNAEKILKAIPKDKTILFGPDKNLGGWLSKKYGRPMELWEGTCEVHVLFTAKELYKLKTENPDAVVIAHPECNPDVLEYAEVIGSTSRLLKEVETNPAKKFIVATEDGIFHQMKKLRPDVELIQAPTGTHCACNQCPYMKLNTLEKIRNSLATLSPEVKLAPEMIKNARVSLQRMVDITQGKSVTWD